MQVHVWDGLREGLWGGLREGLLDGHRVLALYCGSERGSKKFLWDAEGDLYCGSERGFGMVTGTRE